MSSRKVIVSDYPVTAARERFADLVNRVAYGHERVRIVRRGRGLVAMVPIEDLALIEAIEDRIDIEAAKVALTDPTNTPRIPWEQVKAELDL